jgi:hypothetical protein
MNRLDDLAQRAVSSPVASPPAVDAIERRAVRHRRRRGVRRYTTAACVAGIVVVLVAVLLNTGSDDQTSVSLKQPSSRSTTLAEPPIGHVRATRLADGSPVWVVHHRNNSVSVVSAISTHTPDGLRQLVGWCSTARGFQDGMYGSTWDEYGQRVGGPAPSDLPNATARTLSSGRLAVGPLESARPTMPRHPAVSSTRWCFANVATGFDPGTSKLPTYSASNATSVARVRHQVDASASFTFEYVPGAALVVAPDNTVRLCAAGTTSYQTVCTDGPRVNGIDASSLRQQYPAAYQIVRGDLLLRTRNGAVEDTAFTHGYTITTFSPAS